MYTLKSLFLLKKVAHLLTYSNDGDAKHRNVVMKRSERSETTI
jgi:hypothetical protein